MSASLHLVGAALRAEKIVHHRNGLPVTVLAVYDENDTRFESTVPPHVDTNSMLYGVWTGLYPFANELPVKVRGKNGMRFSCLDTFSMMYHVLVHKQGVTSALLQDFIIRIRAALDKDLIHPLVDPMEHAVALSILRSYSASASASSLFSVSTSVLDSAVGVATPDELRNHALFHSQVFPQFQLSDSEQEAYRQYTKMYGRPQMTNVDEVMSVLVAAGLDDTFEYKWMLKRKVEYEQLVRASEHLSTQLSSITAFEDGVAFQPWTLPSASNNYLSKSEVNHDTLVQEISQLVIQHLL